MKPTGWGKRFTFVAAVMLVLGACSAAPAGSGAAGGGTITIGGGFALTGDESALDLPAANGAKLAVKEINAAGGVLGKQINFIVHDSQYKMDVTAQTAKQFVEQDKVPLMIGYTDTDSVLASGPTFQTAKIPFITVGATSPKIPTQVGEPQQDLLSLGRGALRPDAGVEGPSGGPNGDVDVLDVARGDLGELSACGRVFGCEASAGCGRTKRAVDEGIRAECRRCNDHGCPFAWSAV